MNNKIINITAQNLADYPQLICFINPKNKYYSLKINWLKKRFEEGLKIKLLQTEEKKIAGFIEFVPGEFAWRAVAARNYLGSCPVNFVNGAIFSSHQRAWLGD